MALEPAKNRNNKRRQPPSYVHICTDHNVHTCIHTLTHTHTLTHSETRWMYS